MVAGKSGAGPITAFDSAESYEADAYVQWAPQGGGTTGIQTVNVTLNVQGAPEEVPHPNAPVTP